MRFVLVGAVFLFGFVGIAEARTVIELQGRPPQWRILGKTGCLKVDPPFKIVRRNGVRTCVRCRRVGFTLRKWRFKTGRGNKRTKKQYDWCVGCATELGWTEQGDKCVKN